MKKIYITAISTLFLNNLFAIDTPIKGVWQTQKDEKNARIDIQDCADDSMKLCGKIVWLQSPVYPADHPKAGQPKLDINNKDESLRDRPILGMHMLKNFAKESDTKFIDGEIYNPEDGDTYKCTLTLADNGQLEVHGYVEILMFTPGKTQYWKRYEEPASETKKIKLKKEQGQ